MSEPRVIGVPRPGYFKVRAWGRGPWLPAQIKENLPVDPWTGEMLDRGTTLSAFIGDKEVDMDRIWHWGRELTLEEYKWLKAQIAVKPIGTRP